MKSIHRYGLGAVGIAAIAVTIAAPIASADVVGQDGGIAAITANDCGPTPTPTPTPKPTPSPSGTGSSSSLGTLLGGLLGGLGAGQGATSSGTGAAVS
ncbi:hypothetical protein [Nocardia sp. NPDC004722]